MSKSLYSSSQNFTVKKLILARQDNRYTQQEVANLLKKTQSYVSKVESGQRRIDVIELKEFSKIYKRDLSYFLDE